MGARIFECNLEKLTNDSVRLYWDQLGMAIDAPTQTEAIFQISPTAKQSGYGSGFKRVTSLSDNEKADVLKGRRIFFRAERVSAKGHRGTFWRVTKTSERKIFPRVPTPDEVIALRSSTGLV